MYSVIITSSGSGSRMGLGYNKNLFEVNGEMIIEKTINKFVNCDAINEIILGANIESDKENLVRKFALENNIKIFKSKVSKTTFDMERE